MTAFTAHRKLTPTDNYGAACTEGSLLAARFAEHLRDNPGKAGDNTIGRILEELARRDLGDAGHGYMVGFFAELEGMILRGAMTCEPMAVALGRNAHMAAICELAERESVHEVGPRWA